MAPYAYMSTLGSVTKGSVNGSQLVIVEECFYSQIKNCTLISGFRTTAAILTYLNWISVCLGIATTLLSVQTRRRRAAVRKNELPKYHQLSQFEICLALMSVSGLFSAIGLTLSVFVGIRTTWMHAICGMGAWVLYIAVLLFVSMVLKSSSLQNRTLRVVRVFLLPALILPVTVTVGSFVYQGVYQDFIEFESSTTETRSRFNIIVTSVSIMWLVSLLSMDIVVYIARRSFVGHLKTVLESPLMRSGGGGGAGPSADENRGRWAAGSGGKSGNHRVSVQPRSRSAGKSSSGSSGNGVGVTSGGLSANTLVAAQQTEVILALRNAVTTLGWLVLGNSVLVVYSLCYGVMTYLINNSSFLYFSTLFVSYATPFLTAFIIFIVNLINILRQRANINVLEQSLSEESASSGFAHSQNGLGAGKGEVSSYGYGKAPVNAGVSSSLAGSSIPLSSISGSTLAGSPPGPSAGNPWGSSAGYSISTEPQLPATRGGYTAPWPEPAADYPPRDQMNGRLG
ncbi:hypothetical protein HDU96_005268 [Phlyctochytrium bullatum]|nr:hypothetical protein HDU96_005268 [Phlyctochytrium bullatum]